MASQTKFSLPDLLVIASGNAGKVREFSHLLEGYGLKIIPQPEGLDVEETGQTFAENARIKAIAVAKASGHWALADDSGLCVDALGGAPGVHSSRYADSDRARIQRLLGELQQVQITTDSENRRAEFVAALAISDPSGNVLIEVEGRCPGEILKSPRGEGGFGYDPIFYVSEATQTFAEMDKAVKSNIGHRGRAFSLLLPKLRALMPTAM
ncbi:RdgB/HAM1 family non-canonical purine NTP pyrophosphatase [Cyanobium sp. WAJ14-Wanaka]|uniref:RdgB/HAM1 family non-canonical purine NTP pyrophosphatase n=1 Tax=Cyanobium sp. WAJ14-Wanaka TaxID=2823725 RepID=UPI0020CFCBD5|nr:RdgB/HAM1 family non-canonical purine NTP pyrophosphatase [Cyanobium sp. WAJ14-Wanaka]MCP9775809.1 RdgB/HAM1 family non-canonical purine NTP pyrophosphatase [Cyanobium sp. WAJ14-Wanaka]